MTSRPLHVRRLGRISYQAAWDLQRALVDARKADTIPDTLLLLEHDPVVTLGRDGSTASLIFDREGLAARGVDLVQSDRGGDATYHGPGQVVGYVILDLSPDFKDIPRFVRAIEQTMIDTIAEFELIGDRLGSAPGVWLDPDTRPRKIGAVGARISRWITHHGFALNVNTDLDAFGLIIPCGIRDKGVTSIAAELGAPVEIEHVMDRLAAHLARIFGREITR